MPTPIAKGNRCYDFQTVVSTCTREGYTVTFEESYDKDLNKVLYEVPATYESSYDCTVTGDFKSETVESTCTHYPIVTTVHTFQDRCHTYDNNGVMSRSCETAIIEFTVNSVTEPCTIDGVATECTNTGTTYDCVGTTFTEASKVNIRTPELDLIKPSTYTAVGLDGFPIRHKRPWNPDFIADLVLRAQGFNIIDRNPTYVIEPTVNLRDLAVDTAEEDAEGDLTEFVDMINNRVGDEIKYERFIQAKNDLIAGATDPKWKLWRTPRIIRNSSEVAQYGGVDKPIQKGELVRDIYGARLIDASSLTSDSPVWEDDGSGELSMFFLVRREAINYEGKIISIGDASTYIDVIYRKDGNKYQLVVEGKDDSSVAFSKKLEGSEFWKLADGTEVSEHDSSADQSDKTSLIDRSKENSHLISIIIRPCGLYVKLCGASMFYDNINLTNVRNHNLTLGDAGNSCSLYTDIYCVLAFKSALDCDMVSKVEHWIHCMFDSGLRQAAIQGSSNQKTKKTNLIDYLNNVQPDNNPKASKPTQATIISCDEDPDTIYYVPDNIDGFSKTTKRYGSTGNYFEYVKKEFEEGTVAAFEDVKAFCEKSAENMQKFKDLLYKNCAKGYGSVTLGGSLNKNSKRRYYLYVANGTVPYYKSTGTSFLVHASIGSNDILLGSWWGSYPIVAKTPQKPTYELI